jgi:hypothetical protein
MEYPMEPDGQTSPSAHPRPTNHPSPRRKPTIRERVNRELRGALVLASAGLPRRPSERLHNIARGHVSPAGKLPDALADIAGGGVPRETLKRRLMEAVARAVDLTYEALGDAA